MPPPPRSTAAILAVVVLVAVNLRLALSSLPAVATLIQDETGWSDAFIGALTTVPVLGMGVFALGVPRLAGRIGRRSAVSLALVAMAAGLTLRLAGAVAVTLLLSAMLAGLSIAILGGLVPGIVRERLSNSMGLATSLWTAAMMGGAALGAALTLPLSDLTGGWNRALAFWALPAVAALVAWLWLERDQPARVATVAIVRLRDLPARFDSVGVDRVHERELGRLRHVGVDSLVLRRARLHAGNSRMFGIFTGSGIIAALTGVWSSNPATSHLFTATVVGCSASLVAIALVPTFAPRFSWPCHSRSVVASPCRSACSASTRRMRQAPPG